MLKSPSQKIYLTFDFRSQLAYMGMGQNLVPLVNIKIAGKWMFIPLKMVLIGIDPYPYVFHCLSRCAARVRQWNVWTGHKAHAKTDCRDCPLW